MKNTHLCILMQSPLFQIQMNGMRMDELNQKICRWMAHGGNAMVECASMGDTWNTLRKIGGNVSW